MRLLALVILAQCPPGLVCGPPSIRAPEYQFVIQNAPERKYEWLRGIMPDGTKVHVWGFLENGKVVWFPNEQPPPTVEPEKPTPPRVETEVKPRQKPDAGEVKRPSAATPVAKNYGIDLGKTFAPRAEQYHYGGTVGRDFVRSVVSGDYDKVEIPNDSEKLRVTAIGSVEQTDAIRTAFSTGSLASYKQDVIFKGYDPDHPHIKGLGYTAGGKPDVLVQYPSGEVVHHQLDGNLESLGTALRKIAPNRNPKVDPNLASQSCPLGFTSEHWPSIGVIAAFSGIAVLLKHRRPS